MRKSLTLFFLALLTATGLGLVVRQETLQEDNTAVPNFADIPEAAEMPQPIGRLVMPWTRHRAHAALEEMFAPMQRARRLNKDKKKLRFGRNLSNYNTRATIEVASRYTKEGHLPFVAIRQEPMVMAYDPKLGLQRYQTQTTLEFGIFDPETGKVIRSGRKPI